MVTRVLAVAAIAAAITSRVAHAEPVAIWIGNQEAFGVMHAGLTWDYWAPGLAVHARVAGDLELGAEGQAMWLIAAGTSDDHGLALRGALLVDYSVVVWRHDNSDDRHLLVRIAPEIGIGESMFAAPDAPRQQADVFVGVRGLLQGIMRAHSRGGADRRGMEIGLDARLMRTGNELTGALMIDYDWGR